MSTSDQLGSSVDSFSSSIADSTSSSISDSSDSTYDPDFDITRVCKDPSDTWTGSGDEDNSSIGSTEVSELQQLAESKNPRPKGYITMAEAAAEEARLAALRAKRQTIATATGIDNEDCTPLAGAAAYAAKKGKSAAVTATPAKTRDATVPFLSPDLYPPIEATDEAEAAPGPRRLDFNIPMTADEQTQMKERLEAGRTAFLDERCPWDTTVTRREQFNDFQKVVGWIHEFQPADHIIKNTTITGGRRGAKIQKSIDAMNLNMTVIYCYKATYGPQSWTTKKQPTLGHYQEDALFEASIKPMLQWYLNCNYAKKGHMEIKDLLAVNMLGFRRTILAKVGAHGAWSDAYVNERISAGNHSPSICQGVYYPHACALCNMFPTFYNALAGAPRSYLLPEENTEKFWKDNNAHRQY